MVDCDTIELTGSSIFLPLQWDFFKHKQKGEF